MMKTVLWMNQAGMEPLAGRQHQAFHQALEREGYTVVVRQHQPRAPWRLASRCDWLIWSFAPTPVDVWAARLYAKKQLGLIHEAAHHQRVMPGLDHWCVPSESLRMQLIDRGVSHSRVSIVQGYEGRGASTARRQSGENPLIYVAGPQTESAGNLLAVWAMRMVQYLHPQVRMVLHAGGTVDERVRLFASSTCEQGSVELVSDASVDELVGRSDMVWLPRSEDGVPDALFCALEHGKPILAARQPSFLEWLRHDVNALVLSAEHVPPWAGAMDKLMTEQGLAERLGKAARATTRPTAFVELPGWLRSTAREVKVAMAA